MERDEKRRLCPFLVAVIEELEEMEEVSNRKVDKIMFKCKLRRLMPIMA